MRPTGIGAFFKNSLAKQVRTDDLSTDDIIIACVISQSSSSPFYFIYTVSWAQLVREKVV